MLATGKHVLAMAAWLPAALLPHSPCSHVQHRTCLLMKAAPAGVHSSALPPMHLLPRRPPSPHPQESTTLFNLHRIIQTSLCKSKMPSDSRLEQQVGFYKAKLVRKSAGQLRPGVLVLHLSPASGPSLLLDLSLLELPGPICKQAFAFYLRGDKLKAPKTSELASTAGSAFMKGQAPLKYVLALSFLRRHLLWAECRACMGAWGLCGCMWLPILSYPSPASSASAHPLPLPAVHPCPGTRRAERRTLSWLASAPLPTLRHM